jgi:hypothetical protein
MLNIEQDCLSNTFTMLLPNDVTSDSLEWWNWSSSSALEIESYDAWCELDNDYNATDVSLAIANVAGEHSPHRSSFKITSPKFMTLGSPVLHENLSGKFEDLLDMCK